jgi:NCS1 family nucleobase:cation symporter-1
MIEAIWPSYANIPNGIPNSGTTTKDFVSFFIFWLCSLPAIWFPVHQIRHLFTVKSYFTPCAMIAFFAWCIHRANGIGPIVHQPATLEGSALAWAIVKGIMSSIANFATLIVNDQDFSRFAKTPKSALWSQLFAIPLGFAITSFIGIIASSSSTVFLGETVWDPLKLLSQFLVGASSGERFGIFVIATGFALAQLGTNIAANSVSAGTDMTALMPRYISIRRGGYVCAAVGLVMCPWNLLSSSNMFTTYLSAYSVFLSSIAGVILCDYYAVRKGYFKIRELYSARKRSPYYYTFGVSWRGFTAYIAGILINIVGFVGAIGRDVPIGAQYIYNFNYFAGFIVASSVYYLLCRIFPIPATSAIWNEVDVDVDHLTVAYGQEVADEEGRSTPDFEEALTDTKKDRSGGYSTF